MNRWFGTYVIDHPSLKELLELFGKCKILNKKPKGPWVKKKDFCLFNYKIVCSTCGCAHKGVRIRVNLINERLRKTKIRSDLVLVKRTFQGSKRRISSFLKEASCWAILNIAGKINEVSLNDQVWEELDLVVTIPYR